MLLATTTDRVAVADAIDVDFGDRQNPNLAHTTGQHHDHPSTHAGVCDQLFAGQLSSKTQPSQHLVFWLLRRRSQGRTKGEARARARTKAADLLTTSGGDWAPSSPLTDYLDQVVQPSIENASTLKELSRSHYLASLKLVRHELKGYSIHDGTRFRVLEKSLQAIAQKKPGSASSARTVLSKYPITQLIRDGLLDGNPLSGVSLDLEVPRGKGSRGRRTLTRTEWDTVVEHLLTRDVSPLLIPSKHKNIRKSTRAVHGRVVRMTLLQAVTRLRISEANNVQWKHVIEHGDHLLIDATRDIVKGRRGKEKGRLIPILREDVSDYLRSHREDDDHYMIGCPSSTTKPWNPTNADDVVPELYRQVAEATDVALLADLRSHSWRATLHGVYADKIDPATRTTIFGHTEQVADEYYTDRANIESVLRSITL